VLARPLLTTIQRPPRPFAAGWTELRITGCNDWEHLAGLPTVSTVLNARSIGGTTVRS
jgi:hypothetical protein